MQLNPLVHRIRKGQKLEDIQPPLPTSLPSLQTIDSPFQLQEYLALAIRLDAHNVDRIVALPQPSLEQSKSFTDGFNSGPEKGKGRDGEASSFSSMDDEIQAVDTDVWIYEQLRRIVLDFSTPWLTMLQKDCDKNAKPKTCEAMNADDWMYLCASHGEEKQCCAIDYIIHTLDGTTALLNSQRHFPSRTYIPTTSLRHFGSVSRRLSRIFVHAFEHHRDVFEACEAETSLYARFIALVQNFDLIAVESLPQLGDIGNKSSGSNRSENPLPTTSSDLVVPDEFVARNKATPADIMGGDKTLKDESGNLMERRQLFEADVTAPQDDDEEEEEEEEDMNEKVSTPLEPTEKKEGGLDRSGSNASRLTAIHMPQDEREENEQELEQETSEKMVLESPREKPDQKEVPQDVKDDDDDEE